MNVVLFDGICGLCNASVTLLIRLDKKKILKYSALQGEYAKTLALPVDMDNIVFVMEGKLYYKSTAILKIVRSLGGIWVFVNIFYIIPRVMRDFIYDIIAKYRYHIFGKMESCRMPNSEEKSRFIV